MSGENTPAKIQLKFKAGKGGVMPQGTEEILTMEISDGVVALHLQHAGFTRALAKRECQDGVPSVYAERLQKCISKYPGKAKEELINLMMDRIKGLGVEQWTKQ